MNNWMWINVNFECELTRICHTQCHETQCKADDCKVSDDCKVCLYAQTFDSQLPKTARSFRIPSGNNIFYIPRPPGHWYFAQWAPPCTSSSKASLERSLFFILALPITMNFVNSCIFFHTTPRRSSNLTPPQASALPSSLRRWWRMNYRG